MARGIRVRNEKLDLKLIKFATVKSNLDALEEEKKKRQPVLVQMFKDEEIKTHTVEASGLRVKGTLVEATRIKIDEERLKKALGSEVWNRVTSRTLDKSKLEALLALGEIDANVVASCSDESVSSYIKIETKEIDANPDLP